MGRQTSKKKNENTEKKDTIISIVVLSLVLVGIIVAMLYNGGVLDNLSSSDRKINMETGAVVKEIAQLDASIVENENISYPGYEKINFTAKKQMQKVYLYNPKENTCYFQMSIILEDGTVIWQSDYIEPGNAFDRIVLDKSLAKGNYGKATLQYDSYSLKDGRKLNGSAINLILEVE